MTTITELAKDLGVPPDDIIALMESDPTGTEFYTEVAVGSVIHTTMGQYSDVELTDEGVKVLALALAPPKKKEAH